ncbi:hypothetical protein HO133_006656 [Letharia lupina]|uniref:Auxin efflux carrier n=1 Tax=Letharia lupina TaxID=560253 RepID=A0A8H6C6L8_9LECA|nr:uncharacterized protein HO133_006656 [Letharia lupina]KAF6217554.1 hypothetical protein HO133_006656 [Letharia lupina]
MPFFTSPNAFHNANFMATSFSNLNIPAVPGMPSQPAMNQAQLSSGMATPLPPHSSHPALPHLTMLVFEAVLEVVCVSLPGYIIARQGMFTAEMQKFAANLNVTTIKGLHWNNVPGDNDDEVAARGILYLLIFQQLGQLVRWSWGYNVLLAPAEKNWGESEPLMRGSSTDGEGDEQDVSGSDDTRVESRKAGKGNASGSQYGSEFRSGQQTPETHRQHTSSFSTACSSGGLSKSGPDPDLLPTPANGNIKPAGRMMSFPSVWSKADPIDGDVPQGLKGIPMRCRTAMKKATCTFSRFISKTSGSAFGALPGPLQRCTTKIATVVGRLLLGVWSFMNPPLWAMLVAIVVASIPDLQRFFFANGTFFKNSVTSAIRQSGGVAVPLILVVLGGNLARNTLPADPSHTREDEKEETKLLIASIISRMLLPFIIMAPLLAVTAKYVPVSILDDPIFVIVCFLITGAPSALQLAQICQINNVYMGTMSRLLFQSYVVWILPSTLVLVMCALEVVEWAQR